MNRLAENSEAVPMNCLTCGQVIDRKNTAFQTSVDDEKNSDRKETFQSKKKESQPKKSLDLSNYKMGVVPK